MKVMAVTGSGIGIHRPIGMELLTSNQAQRICDGVFPRLRFTVPAGGDVLSGVALAGSEE
jgi:hypothetical protein